MLHLVLMQIHRRFRNVLFKTCTVPQLSCILPINVWHSGYNLGACIMPCVEGIMIHLTVYLQPTRHLQ